MFKPMLAGTAPDDWNDITYPVLASPKLDGIRCLIRNGVAFSRKMIAIPNLEVQELVKDLPDFDGELMLDGKDFTESQSIIMAPNKPVGDLKYHVFDLVVGGEGRGFSGRFQALCQLVRKMDNPFVVVVEHAGCTSSVGLSMVHNRWVGMGYEGTMVRSPDGPYKQGRATTKEGYLMKLKDFHDDEAMVLDLVEKLHNNNVAEKDNLGRTKRSTKKDGMVPAGVLGSLRVVNKAGKEFKVGSGFDDKQRQYYWDNPDEMIGKLITYRYQELTKYGVPRFPVFKGIRDEKDVV